MESSFSIPEPNAPDTATPPDPTPTWNYPTRMCRICHEEVVPTVSLYPPGLPPAFQRPFVEYKNEDEYGRLIKPCRCRGGMRYIHELCLRRSRVEGHRPGSMWKCHECGHQFNFKRLTVQRYLGSKPMSGLLTIIAMVAIMFILGFVADPIINLYVDPYDTLVGKEYVWQEVQVNEFSGSLSAWAQHFMKGLVSMGLVGFLKTALLNPFQWWNLRNTGWVSGRSTGHSTTGRDRVVNVSWIAILIGVSSAFYFFYQWVQAIIVRVLQRIGNNIVDTQLPGDDDDLKPLPGFKAATASPVKDPETPTEISTTSQPLVETPSQNMRSASKGRLGVLDGIPGAFTSPEEDDGGWIDIDSADSSQGCLGDDQTAKPRADRTRQSDAAFSSALDGAHSQGWSFSGI